MGTVENARDFSLCIVLVLGRQRLCFQACRPQQCPSGRCCGFIGAGSVPGAWEDAARRVRVCCPWRVSLAVT